MPFFAYESEYDCFDHEGRDETVGILGRFKATKKSIAEAADLPMIELLTFKYLIENPRVTVYITDDHNRVLKIVNNTQYGNLETRTERRLTIAVSLLIFCMTALTMEVVGVSRNLGLYFFVGASLLFLVVLWARLYTEIEAAVTCEMILLAIFFVMWFGDLFRR